MADSTFGNPLAELYSLWALNPLVEVARILSHDVAIRPQHYQSLSPKLSNAVTGLRYKVGNDPSWPDVFQRSLAFKPLYKVGLATPQLREAALRYMERPSEPLRESFRLAASSSAESLAPLLGQSLDLSALQVRSSSRGPP